MADARERSWERCAAAGDELAAVRWAVERLRRGALDPRRLRLAARLGDPLARRLVGGGAPPPPDLEALLRSLGRWDGTPWGRAAVAAAEAALPHWEPRARVARKRSSARERAAARGYLDAARAFLACPCPRHEGALRARRPPPGARFLRGLEDAARHEVPERPRAARATIRASARVAGEAPVREAVRADLLGWALADPRR
ncbi:MAG: hypothetical protein D6731_19965 [Planctomycetota bacterium]|nr:MAG: hypothetical protein D6731_19965 [Planctomycetota bacterium]